ncbi:MAG: hypothetical protein RMM53_03190 [Bacteroidia bacterium]|nr:hypothetical protein [Bacteroidia bacterium]MDW8333203.1 hypothetical protein [Bacteroidia bacterium]
MRVRFVSPLFGFVASVGALIAALRPEEGISFAVGCGASLEISVEYALLSSF